jgi:hypothetical protein
MALSRASILIEEMFFRQTVCDTIKEMKQNATFLCGPFSKEGLGKSAKPLIYARSKAPHHAF